jgi:hypothetical protein
MTLSISAHSKPCGLDIAFPIRLAAIHVQGERPGERMTLAFDNRFQRRPESIEQRRIEMSECVIPALLYSERREQWSQFAATMRIHVQRCPCGSCKQIFMALAFFRTICSHSSDTSWREIAMRLLALSVFGLCTSPFQIDWLTWSARWERTHSAWKNAEIDFGRVHFSAFARSFH